MSNSISFVGRLGADSELKHVGEQTVLEFRVANNVGFGDKKTTNWFRCNLWGRRGQSIESYLTKGKQVFVTGELALRPYTNRDGVEQISSDINVTNVDFISGADNAAPGGGGQMASAGVAAPAAPAVAPQTPESEDDMPF